MFKFALVFYSSSHFTAAKKSSTLSHERTGSFWKRRSRKNTAPDGPVEDYYDFLFKNFLKTVNTKPDPLSQYLVEKIDQNAFHI